MAVQKNFVVKNGIEVNTNLIFGDTGSNKVGIATTNPRHTLHVNGGIGATNSVVTGISTVNDLIVNGRIGAGSSFGTAGQYLVSTGTGVTWGAVPTVRSTDLQTAGVGATTFNTTYTVGLLDVYVNGVKLSSDEYSANNGATVVLDDACFGGETVEFVSYSPFGIGVGGTSIQGITILEEGSPVGSALQVTSINFVGAAVTAVGSGIGVTVYLADYITSSGIASYSDVAGVSTIAQGLTGTPNIEVGIVTATNVVIGGGTTQLIVTGDARVTGILTIGTSSITLDGSTDTINVGSGVTIDGTAGTISATSFVGDGSGLIGVVGSGSGIVILDDGSTVGTAGTIDFGANLSVSAISAGVVTVTASGGASTQWETTAAGINTLSSVGIGTTNPTSTLTVKGDTSLETLNVSGVSTLGTSNISGDLTFTGNNDIYLKDGGVINFGDGNDLQIFHNGSVSVIRDGGTGGLLIDSDNEVKIAKNGTGNDNLAVFTPDGSVELYYDNSKKFETIGVGVTVTGTTFTNQLNVSGVSTSNDIIYANGGIKVANDFNVTYGNNAELIIGYWQTGGVTRIRNQTAVPFEIDLASNANSTLTIKNNSNTLGFFSRTNVELYNSGTKRFETIGAGVTVTGTTFTNQLSVSGVSTFGGNTRFNGDLRLYGTENIKFFDGSDNVIGSIIKNGNITYYTRESYEKHIFQNGFGPSQNLFEIGSTNYSYKDFVVSGLTSTTTLTVGTGGTVITTTSGGNVGIGTTNASSKLTVRGGDISVGVSTAHGVILTSPNGTQYRLIVADDGTLSTVAV